MTFTAATTTIFLFDMCDFTIDSDVGTIDFSLVLGILYVCGHTHKGSHVSPSMDSCFKD